MPKKSLSATVVATSRLASPPKRVAERLASEALTLQRWLDRDPQTPYRREAAARIRELADELERSR